MTAVTKREIYRHLRNFAEHFTPPAPFSPKIEISDGHYLIVDPRDGTCVHFWAIVERDGNPVYDARVPYVFGDKIPVGDWIIDTAELPRYDREA
ncbi:hypothetical protein ABIA32_005114 [Streptacidiphilus sp. MAP12-20]|uniref:hypothetical protein n=1 Tax=Streptacidiphilus sp. MAP12-20 TaxID=3156299 RepID=UPI00351920D7